MPRPEALAQLDQLNGYMESAEADAQIAMTNVDCSLTLQRLAGSVEAGKQELQMAAALIGTTGGEAAGAIPLISDTALGLWRLRDELRAGGRAVDLAGAKELLGGVAAGLLEVSQKLVGARSLFGSGATTGRGAVENIVASYALIDVVPHTLDRLRTATENLAVPALHRMVDESCADDCTNHIGDLLRNMDDSRKSAMARTLAARTKAGRTAVGLNDLVADGKAVPIYEIKVAEAIASNQSAVDKINATIEKCGKAANLTGGSRVAAIDLIAQRVQEGVRDTQRAQRTLQKVAIVTPSTMKALTHIGEELTAAAEDSGVATDHVREILGSIATFRALLDQHAAHI